MPTVDDHTLPDLLPHLARSDAGWCATWESVSLQSVFQPVLSVTHRRIVGYEALLRAHDHLGTPVPPEALFAATRSSEDARKLDRLARCMHVANFVEQGIDDAWLFLNTRPQVFETSWPQRVFIDELSAHFGLPQERIVIEVLEQPADDEAAVASILAADEPRDFLIAIDDFGIGFSNFDRVWRFRPDIVKLDRSLIARAGKRDGDNSMISHLISMLHQLGTMVLAEGVETDEELMILMQADVDFVQGFWLGQPEASVRAASAQAPELIESMWSKFSEYERTHARHQRVSFDGLAETVLAGAEMYATGADLATAAQKVFDFPEARRVFVTNALGHQMLPSIIPHEAAQPPARLAPLFPQTYSNWSRRAYFKHALAAPGRVAMMGPHRSLADGEDCYTAAVAVERGGELNVFCVDFTPATALSRSVP